MSTQEFMDLLEEAGVIDRKFIDKQPTTLVLEWEGYRMRFEFSDVQSLFAAHGLSAQKVFIDLIFAGFINEDNVVSIREEFLASGGTLDDEEEGL